MTKKQQMTFDQAIALCRQAVKVHRHDWGSGYLVVRQGWYYMKLVDGRLEPYPASWTDRNAKDWETFEEAWW
jgi:hypothetical protein